MHTSPHTNRHFAPIMLGVITGINNIGGVLAFSALLFAGPLAAGMGMAVGSMLLGAAILVFIVALRSSNPNTIALPQETSIAILAASIAIIATDMSQQDESVRIATAFAILGSSTLITGIVFWSFGRLKLGVLVRYLPYPVIAGFLAGTGWLLIEGAFMMLSGERTILNIIKSFATGIMAAKAIPALAFAALLILVVKRSSNPLTYSSMLIGAGVVFYVVLMALGISTEEARALTWLPNIAASQSVSIAMPHQIIMEADWGKVFSVLPIMLSIALLNIVGLLLNNSGLELSYGREIDANTELRASGIGNLIAGIFLGASGYVTLSMTHLANKMGIKDRSAGIATAAIIAISIFSAAWLSSIMPFFLAAGLMIFLGIELLIEWVVISKHKLPFVEWLVIIGIVLCIALFGFMSGLMFGLALSIIVFVFNYSNMPVLRMNFDNTEFRSSVDRSVSAMHILNNQGEKIYAMQLQNYIFFGTSEKIVSHVRARLSERESSPLSYFIFDFRHVVGVDSSAISCFIKLRNMAEQANVKIIFCHLSDNTLKAFTLAQFKFSKDGTCLIAPDIDHALEWCEDALLSAQNFNETTHTIDHYLKEILGSHPRIPDMIAAMAVLEFMPGAKIINIGESADDVFLLSRGKLRVQTTLSDGRSIRLRTLTSGTIFGEIALYLGGQRTADVIVEEPSIIYGFSRTLINKIEETDSELALLFHKLLAFNLAEKLVVANRLVDLSQR